MCVTERKRPPTRLCLSERKRAPTKHGQGPHRYTSRRRTTQRDGFELEGQAEKGDKLQEVTKTDRTIRIKVKKDIEIQVRGRLAEL